MSLIAARTTLSIWSLVTDLGPRVSPAITTLLVVASVSQAARIARVDAGFRTFAEKQIDDLIGNPVANLVRMTLGNRLAGEQIRRAHQPTPCSRRTPAAVYVFYPGMSVAAARNDVGFVVKPKSI